MYELCSIACLLMFYSYTTICSAVRFICPTWDKLMESLQRFMRL